MAPTEGVAILIPVLNRPHNIGPLLESIVATTTVPWHVTLLATVGYHDEIAAVEAAVQADSSRVRSKLCRRLPMQAGDYATKINTGVALTSEPFLFFGADDIRFHPGWFEAAATLMSDDVWSCHRAVGVVGTNDMGPWRPNSPSRDAVSAGEHATHCLVARWYTEFGSIDNPTQVLHPGYPHEFCDDEFTATARHRGAWGYADDSHVEHLHPHLGKGESDSIYAAAPARLRKGRALYRQRCALWREDPPKR